MRRRLFLKASGIALGTGLAENSLLAKIPPHNFDRYDFGGGPPVSDRFYQGPFYLSQLVGGHGADRFPRSSAELRNGAYHAMK